MEDNRMDNASQNASYNDYTYPQAVRSSGLYEEDPELLGLEQAERVEIKKQADKDQIKLNQIKSLKNHPGWIQIKNDILDKRIQDYKSGESLRLLCNDGKMSNAELGQRLRESMAVADEVQLLVNIIENAGSDEK